MVRPRDRRGVDQITDGWKEDLLHFNLHSASSSFSSPPHDTIRFSWDLFQGQQNTANMLFLSRDFAFSLAFWWTVRVNGWALWLKIVHCGLLDFLFDRAALLSVNSKRLEMDIHPLLFLSLFQKAFASSSTSGSSPRSTPSPEPSAGNSRWKYSLTKIPRFAQLYWGMNLREILHHLNSASGRPTSPDWTSTCLPRRWEPESDPRKNAIPERTTEWTSRCVPYREARQILPLAFVDFDLRVSSCAMACWHCWQGGTLK